MSLRTISIAVLCGAARAGHGLGPAARQCTGDRAHDQSSAWPRRPIPSGRTPPLRRLRNGWPRSMPPSRSFRTKPTRPTARPGRTARDAVASLRTIRETYRKELDGVVAQGRADDRCPACHGTRTALTAPWTQFEQALDQDVAAIRLDANQRKALVEARIRAEQTYWQCVVTDLQATPRQASRPSSGPRSMPGSPG